MLENNNNLLSCLYSKAYAPAPDLKAIGNSPNKVNVLELMKDEQYVVIAAAHGSGKTYSCLPIADSAIYVSNRRALVAAKSKEFKSAMCVNSFCWLSIETLNEHKYLILDEINAVLKAVLSWKKVDYERFCLLLQQFKGIIICLDASATEAITNALNKLSKKQFKFYQHECGNRGKTIGFTNSVDQVMQLSKDCGPGVKLIVCDKKTTAIRLDKTAVVPGEKFLITGDNSSEANEVLAKAAKCDNAWVFASPCLQEGFSIEYDNFVFNASIHEGAARQEDEDKIVLLPIDAAIQGLFRVRDLPGKPGIVRIFCSDNKITEAVIDEKAKADELRVDFLKYTDLLENYALATVSKQCTPDEYLQSHKLIGFEAFAHLRYITSIQNSASWDITKQTLQSFGFDLYDFTVAELETSIEYVEPEDEAAAIDEAMHKFVNDKPIDERLLKRFPFSKVLLIDEAKGYTEKMATLRCTVGLYYGIEKANDAEFITEYYTSRHHEFAKARGYLISLNLPGKGALHYEKTQAKFCMLNTLLKNELGEDFQHLGNPEAKEYFVLNTKSLYSNPAFSALRKEFKASGNGRQTWFWRRCLGEHFGFNYKLFGKDKTKYKLFNDIRTWQHWPCNVLNQL